MTCDEFDMDLHSIRAGSNHFHKVWDIVMRDGDTKIYTSVYDEAIQESVGENFDDFSDTIKEKLLDRIDDKWDRGEISDAERDTLLRMIEVILP